jgi:hypothetical protein
VPPAPQRFSPGRAAGRSSAAKVVWQWRMAFGIARDGTEGSARLIQAAADKGGAVLRGQKQPAEWVERWAPWVQGGR